MSTISEYALLNTIQSPTDVRSLSNEQLVQLAYELRGFMVASVLETGGHLSSSLGAVELCLALHCELNTPKDGLIWDVGHQAYAHKLITGRSAQFHTLRQAGGLSAFLNPNESKHDAFITGHAGNSVSAALGMALASQLKQETANHCAIVGDGALTSGMVFEALNHAGSLSAPLLIVVNDNDWSISKNMGALQHALHQDAPDLRLFESLNIATPVRHTVDGHNITTLRAAIKQSITHAHAEQTAVILYVKTQKGHGYAPAEQDPLKYHGVKPNTAIKHAVGSAQDPHAQSLKRLSFSQAFGDWLHHAMQNDKRIVAITPAMIEGSGLQRIAQDFPERLFDVGIAEQHAVTLAAGLAQQGMRPVVAIYSTFLQRAYDQVIHDVALQPLSILFAIDRAGLVGADGSTHHGVFDISFMRTVPNVRLLTPSNQADLHQALDSVWAHTGITAVRYPRDVCLDDDSEPQLSKTNTGAMVIRQRNKSSASSSNKAALLVFGSLLYSTYELADALNLTLVNMRSVKPLDNTILTKLASTHTHWITLEEHQIAGGAGGAVAEWLVSNKHVNIQLMHLGISDTFIGHGNRESCLHEAKLTPEHIQMQITDWLDDSRPNNTR